MPDFESKKVEKKSSETKEVSEEEVESNYNYITDPEARKALAEADSVSSSPAFAFSQNTLTGNGLTVVFGPNENKVTQLELALDYVRSLEE